jgi:serine/threonine protein kinase
VVEDATGEEFALKKIHVQSRETQKLISEEVKVWK